MVRQLNRREFLGLSGALAVVAAADTARSKPPARLAQQGSCSEGFKKWDMSDGVKAYQAPARQILTKHDGTELSIYEKGKMTDGDKIYDIAGDKLLEARRKLGWGQNDCEPVTVFAKEGKVQQISFKGQIWP